MQNKTLRRLTTFGALVATLLVSYTFTVIAADEPLKYISPGKTDASLILAPPPMAGSAEQAADMRQVFVVYHACTTNEAALAFSEKKFSVFNFTPAVGNFFQKERLPMTEAFFARVQKEAEVVADLGKDFWKRPRPFTVDTNLAAGKLEKSFGYPSGHSTEGMTLALVLADLIPEKSEAIIAVGRDLGWHRVWIARHYPTDIYAGRVLAGAVAREMKASSDFQKDFDEVKKEIAAAKP
ncbi:MAG: phosphatase PAP2 family protein [Verrucomicrobiales bacterium]|nr:MAG: phosphatase PAP2 family protein [Verrucomicrobiales bacterium]